MKVLWSALAVLILAIPVFGLEPVAPAAASILQRLVAMDVEHHWTAGQIVDWRTGDPSGRPIRDFSHHTHCSQFVAAACERLGVYILRPPEHSPVLLANVQSDWLRDQGAAAGWTPVSDGVAAQDLANQGKVVVAVYKSPDPKRPGHIAIVRPGQKSADRIRSEGPDVIQAGMKNRSLIALKSGFSSHPGHSAATKSSFTPTTWAESNRR